MTLSLPTSLIGAPCLGGGVAGAFSSTIPESYYLYGSVSIGHSRNGNLCSRAFTRPHLLGLVKNRNLLGLVVLNH